jgi:hypothetical protein
MNIVLKNQIEASEKSAHEIEIEFQQTHRWAMLCHDVQDLARSAVKLFSEMNDDVERWQADMLAKDSNDSAGFEGQREEFYRRLANVFEKTAGLIQATEDAGFAFDGKAEFLAAWRELRGIVCFSRDEISIAVEQSRRGELRSLGEIELELRDLPNH